MEVWFVTGSQHLYGAETLKKVAQHSQEMAQWLLVSGKLPVKVIFKPVVTTPEAVTGLCREANNTQACIGFMRWVHTFFSAKNWVFGFRLFSKTLLYIH